MSQPPETKTNTAYSRRQFLIRSVKAGLSAVAAGTIGYVFYDSKAPDPTRYQTTLTRLPDFSIPDPKHRMAVVRGEDRMKTVQMALKAMGGIETFIKPGDRVLIKVNAAFATPPMLSATTHPDLVKAVARLCFQSGASDVIVSDNPINDPASCFDLSGIREAARSAGAQVILPENRLFEPITLSGGRLIRNWPILYAPFKTINKLIGMAPIKDHHRSGASMSMKNWYGLLGGRRNIFHQDIHNIIKELSMMVTPTLVILDGITTMMSNGPTGGSLSDLKATHTMIVSTDQVAADAFGATLLGKAIHELPFISKAEAVGSGTSDYNALNPITLSI